MGNDVINIIYIALALLLLGAVGGIIMAFRVFQGKGLAIPPALAGAHGTLGGLGITLILAVFLTYRDIAPTTLSIALGVLVVAASGGFYLVSFHIRRKPQPKPVVPIHAYWLSQAYAP